METKKLSFITLLLLISFASINAVLFTPALPQIAHFFAVDPAQTELTLTYYLLGYTLGQLIYGPLANRFGRKPTLYIGISVAVISSFICIFAGFFHSFSLLILGRFFLALGAGCGLKMTFTLVNETYSTQVASKLMSYLVMAFAITPGLGVAIGGILTQYFGWQSCFYASAIYSLILLGFVIRLPETLKAKDYQALKLNHLFLDYIRVLKIPLLISSFLMGCCTMFVYLFAAAAPFIAINLLGFNSAEYGITNMIPATGMLLGSLYSAYLANYLSLHAIIKRGIMIAAIGVVIMILGVLYTSSAITALFIPTAIIYFGLCSVIANVSTLGLSQIADKSHGSAVLNFINMGVATLVVILLSHYSINKFLLPSFYFIIVVTMMILFYFIRPRKNMSEISA